MGSIVVFKHNGKVYEMENNYIMVPNNEAYTEEERNKAFIKKMKDKISQRNRSEAQRKRYERKRILNHIEEMKCFGIPFTEKSWKQWGITYDAEKMKYYGIEFEEE